MKRIVVAAAILCGAIRGVAAAPAYIFQRTSTDNSAFAKAVRIETDTIQDGWRIVRWAGLLGWADEPRRTQGRNVFEFRYRGIPEVIHKNTLFGIEYRWSRTFTGTHEGNPYRHPAWIVFREMTEWCKPKHPGGGRGPLKVEVPEGSDQHAGTVEYLCDGEGTMGESGGSIELAAKPWGQFSQQVRWQLNQDARDRGRDIFGSALPIGVLSVVGDDPAAKVFAAGAATKPAASAAPPAPTGSGVPSLPTIHVKGTQCPVGWQVVGLGEKAGEIACRPLGTVPVDPKSVPAVTPTAPTGTSGGALISTDPGAPAGTGTGAGIIAPTPSLVPGAPATAGTPPGAVPGTAPAAGSALPGGLPASMPKTILFLCDTDDSGRVWVNHRFAAERSVAEGKGCSRVDITSLLKPGLNWVRFVLTNQKGPFSYRFGVQRGAHWLYREACGRFGEGGCEESAKPGVVRDFSLPVESRGPDR